MNIRACVGAICGRPRLASRGVLGHGWEVATHAPAAADDAREVARRRRARAIVAVAVGLVLAATLFPFRFRLDGPHLHEKIGEIEWEIYYTDRPGHVTIDRDLLQNVVLFAPLGAALAMLPRAPRWGRDLGVAVGIGLGLSITVELLQLLTETRITQLADVWRNGLGALLGAIAVVAARRRASSPMA